MNFFKNIFLYLLIYFLLHFSLSIHADETEERLKDIETRLDLIEELLNLDLNYYENKFDSISNETSDTSESKSNESEYVMVNCIEVYDQKISVIETNDVFEEYAWIIDYKNSCPVDFTAYPVLKFLDKDEFILHEISYPNAVFIPANSTARAKGKELISPISKANRIAITSASLKSSIY